MLRGFLPYLAVIPSAAYSLISLGCAASWFPKSGTVRNNAPPPVSIIKPVKGIDEGSFENFTSFCRQDYGAPVQIIFTAAGDDDAAIPAVERLMSENPGFDISLVTDHVMHGPNQKVSNLINAFPKARHDIIIICDSDIRVPPDYLNSVTSHFSDPGTGLVTSLYRTSDVHGIATALEATGFTAEMIPNVLVALKLEGLSFALGASMAVRREALAAIGGFAALADYLADDYQLGNKIHSAGYRLALDPCFVESMIRPESLAGILSRQLRWARTMRISRPGGYLASGITFPFPALVAALLLAADPEVGVRAALLLYGIRLAVCTIFSRCFVRDNLLPRYLWLVPLRDMLSFFTWAASFLGNRVVWRGSRFRLRPGGKIEEMA